MDEKNKRSNAHISILAEQEEVERRGRKGGGVGSVGGLKQTQRVKWSMLPTEKIAAC